MNVAKLLGHLVHTYIRAKLMELSTQNFQYLKDISYALCANKNIDYSTFPRLAENYVRITFVRAILMQKGLQESGSWIQFFKYNHLFFRKYIQLIGLSD